MGPNQEMVDRWDKKIKESDLMNYDVGLSAADAVAVISNGVEDEMWRIDKGIRSFELGDIYPIEDFIDRPNEGKLPPDNSNWLARKGDPTWYPGRQTQLARREA